MARQSLKPHKKGLYERDRKHNRHNEYDLMNVIVLRINDHIKTEDTVLSLLQTLCSNLIQKDQKLQLLKEQGIRMDDQMEKEVSVLCNLSELVEINAKKQVALRMLKKHIPLEDVAEFVDVPVETVKQWEAEAFATA